MYHHFDQFHMQLAPQHIMLQNFLGAILKEHTINEYTVRDSFSFCNEIRKQDLSFYTTSFDIQSLFTNISLDETINICVNGVFQRKK